MRPNLTIFLFILCLVGVRSAKVPNLRFSLNVKIVSSFLNLFESCHDLNLKVCWTEHDKYYLISSITLGPRLKVVNMDEVSLPSGESEFRTLIIMDLCCDETFTLLNRIQWNKFEHMKWFFMNSCPGNEFLKEKELLSIINVQNMRVGSQVYYVSYRNNGEPYIVSPYKLSDDLPIQIESIAWWNQTMLVDERRHISQVERRRNLALTPVRGSMVLLANKSREQLTIYRDRPIDTPSKLNFNMAMQVTYFLNASLQLSIVKTWGYPDKETGYWPGMLGELIRDEADLGITPMFFVTYRLPVIDYISYTTKGNFRFVFRSPKLSVTNNVFILPFTKLVWLSSIVLVLLMMCIYFIVDIVEWKFINNRTTGSVERNVKPKFIDSAQTIFNAICQQGIPNTPKFISSRTVVFIAFLILMLFYTSYAANIVALLQSPSNKIRTVKDLYHSRLELGVQDTPYNRYYFSVSFILLFYSNYNGLALELIIYF